MRLAVVNRQFAHHSRHSGYRQLIRRQPGVAYIQPWVPDGLSERAADALVRRADRIAYTRTSLGFEVAAARRIAARPGAMYHVPYGEDDLHFLPRVAPILHGLGGRLMASFHQPPKIFDEAVPCAGRVLPRLDAAAVTTREQATHLSRWMAADRIHHVPLGVDLTFFTPRPEARAADGTMRLITVGTWQRDFVVFRQVAEAFAARAERVTFVVVSPPRYAGTLDGVPGVEVHRRVSDEQLRDLYRSSDALFLPLVQSAANNALLEAMACGCPIVATDLAGIREYVGDSGARLFPPHDSTAAIAAIDAFFSEPDAIPALGRRARRRAEAFDVDRMAQRLAYVYRDVWGARAVARGPGRARPAASQRRKRREALAG